jgi:tRNA pseudouridine13 synthase
MPIPSWLDQTPALSHQPRFPRWAAAFAATPEDFCVEERPLYLPCGARGASIYSGIKKRGLSTPDLVDLRLCLTTPRQGPDPSVSPG